MSDSKEKKKFGRFYTPPSLAGLLSKLLLKEYLKTNHSGDINILDPSCGDGAFLVETFNQLKKIDDGNRVDRKISLHGIDIDKNAILKVSSKLELLLKNERHYSYFTSVTDTLFEKKVIRKPNLTGNIFPGSKIKNGFDIIIGNPPWVSLLGKHAQDIYSKEQLRFLLNRYPCDKFRPNLFEMFIWRSLELLKPMGYLGFIIPDRLFHNSQFRELRNVIFATCELKFIIFGTRFENVKSDNLIFILQKTVPKTSSTVKVRNYSQKSFISLNQSSIADNGKYRYLFIGTEAGKIIDKIEHNPNIIRLKDLFESGVGFICKKEKITYERESDKQLKIISGRDISYNKIYNYKYLEFNKANLLGGTTKISKLAQKPKIVLRKTGNKLISAIDKKGYHPEQSLYFITSKRKSFNDLLLLNRFLSSDLLNFYYLNMAVTNVKTTPQLKKSDLDCFPVISYEQFFKIIKSALIMRTQVTNPKNISNINSISEDDIYRIFNITIVEKRFIENFLREN